MEGREAQARREQAEAQAAIRLQARRDAVRAEGHPDVSRVREAVAARYQQSLSYREFLAAEARRAAEQAQAEAEVAARKAKAVAEAQRQLLEEMEQWHEPSPKRERRDCLPSCRCWRWWSGLQRSRRGLQGVALPKGEAQKRIAQRR